MSGAYHSRGRSCATIAERCRARRLGCSALHFSRPRYRPPAVDLAHAEHTFALLLAFHLLQAGEEPRALRARERTVRPCQLSRFFRELSEGCSPISLDRSLRSRFSFSRLHRGIHLSERDLEADPFASPSSRRPRPRRSLSRDDTSDISSVHSLEDDELPTSSSSTRFATSSPFPSRRAYELDTRPARSLASSAFSSLQTGLSSAADALGWSAERATSAMRGEGQRGDGFARAFWGLRQNERTGGIRLGEGSSRDEEQLRGVGGKAARVLGISSSPPRENRSHGRSDSVATDGSGALFEVGDTDDGADAVELPTNFALGAGGHGRGGT